MANLGTIKSLTLTNGDTATLNIPYYTGTGTKGRNGSASANYIPSIWTFDIGYTPVYGDMIMIKVPVAGVASGVWMSVDNGVTYYPVSSQNKERLTTQYIAEKLVLLIYETNATTTIYGTTKDGAPKGSSAADFVSNRWTVVNGFNSNTTYSAMTSAEMETGTATTNRVMTAVNLKAGLKAVLEAVDGDVQLYGEHLTGHVPAVTSSDNGKILKVVNGIWSIADKDTFSDNDPTLSWGTRSKVGTTGGTDLHVTMPAMPSYTAQDVGALPSNTIYVSGVKGNSENDYRYGQVNITPENIGAVATTDVVDNLTSTATNKPLSAAQGKALATIGETKGGTVVSDLSIPTGTWTSIASVSLTSGTWIITGHAGLSSNYDGVVQIRLGNSNSTLVRFNGQNGGGAMTMLILKLSESNSIPFEIYQASGDAKTAANVAVAAVRVGL